jgi:Fuc2NAc and GlcNAc transferase
MSDEVRLWPLLAFLPPVTASACALYLRWAGRAGWLAQPEARSSHRVATPSGAGLPVILLYSLALFLAGPPLNTLEMALPGLAVALALPGFIDDRRGLGVRLRLLLHAMAAATLALTVYPGLLSNPVHLFLALSLSVWLMGFANLFNFMDGIDGLAALQAISATVALGALGLWTGAASGYVALCAGLGAAQLGFLALNRPPAQVFMGDAGSIPTGFLLAALVWTGWAQQGLPIGSGLLLLGAFLSDSLTTLVFRAARGAPLAEAHREHLYQRLARRWQSHARVDAVFLLVQWLWLTPLAAICLWLTPLAGLILGVLGLLPLLLVMVKFRSIE